MIRPIPGGLAPPANRARVRQTRTILAFVAVFGAAFSLACGSGAEDASRTDPPPAEATSPLAAVPTPAPTPTVAPVPTPTVAPVDTPTVAPVVAPTVAPVASPTARPRSVAPASGSLDAVQRASDLVARAFHFDQQVRFFKINTAAVEELGELGQEEAAIPLIELIIFATQRSEIVALDDALEKLTGERFGAGDWRSWYRWIGEHPEVEPVAGFGDWKADLYKNVDPRFESFFRGDPDSRIPLWTVQWGGVVLDGIRPLENPPTIPASEADFLDADELVFGVSVNGHARAYPWRIMATHELANDVVGGRPVTFVF